MAIKPARLLPGDTVAIVSPASPPAEPKNFELAAKALEKLGYRARVMANARKRHGFLAGSDEQRAADLMRAFADRNVKAIWCMRGGHGATRLLPLLDYPVIRKNPKIFLGYSDVTALHCALLSHANLVTFHGPMLNADVVTQRFPAFTRDGFFRTLADPAAAGSICTGYSERTVRVLRGGVAEGELLGGNLTMLCSLLGTPWQPSFKRKILFFEDVNEAPYRVDRMLAQLSNAGLLKEVAGVGVGRCHQCEDATASKRREFRQSLEDVLRDWLLPLKVPVVAGLPFGHVHVNATLPLGVRARLDGRGDLSIMAGAVR